MISYDWYVGDEENALRNVFEIDFVKQVFAVEDRKVKISYDWLAHYLCLKLFDIIELCRVFIILFPVWINQIINYFLSESFRNLSVPFQSFWQKSNFIATSLYLLH